MDAVEQVHMIQSEVRAFMLERRSRGLSQTTMAYYYSELGLFERWAQVRELSDVETITPNDLRAYLLYLEDERHRNKGGVQDAWRAVRAFFRWFEDEYDPTDWRNPIRRVQPPRRPHEPITGIGLGNVSKLLATCDGSYFGLRDAAMFLSLIDSGLRIGELAQLNIGDVDMRSGTVIVRHGKGDKEREAFLSAKSLRAISKYLRMRSDADFEQPLFSTREGGRLSRSALTKILHKHGDLAGIKPGGWHNFRRTYALEMLRDGTDVVSLARLLGHSDTSLVMLYAKQTETDLQKVAARHSPVDHLR